MHTCVYEAYIGCFKSLWLLFQIQNRRIVAIFNILSFLVHKYSVKKIIKFYTSKKYTLYLLFAKSFALLSVLLNW